MSITWVAVLAFLLVVGVLTAVHTRAARFRRALAAADHEEILAALRDIRDVLADSFGTHEQTVHTLTEIRDQETEVTP